MIYDGNGDDNDDNVILESFNINKWKCEIIMTSSSCVSFVLQLPTSTIICVTLSGDSSYTELVLGTKHE